MAKTFKPLTDEELAEFIATAEDDSDIEVERERFLEATKDVIHAPSRPDVSQFNFVSGFTPNLTLEQRRANQRQLVAYQKVLREHKHKKVLAIKREHVRDGTMHELYEPLQPKLLKALITELTEESRAKMYKQKEMLTSRLEIHLRAHIPNIVRRAYDSYPHVFKKCEGFQYEVSEHFGGYKLFVEPDLPAYFTDYMAVITDKLDTHIFQYDKLVEKYYEYSKALIKEETRYAFKFSKFKNRLAFLETDVDNYEKYVELYEMSKLQ